MKKLLALILSIIMVLSIMPMAFAQRAEFSPEIEEYIDALEKAEGYAAGIYETPEQQFEVQMMYWELLQNVELIGLYRDFINIEAEGRLDEITALSDHLNKLIDEIERKIAKGDLVLVVNAYEFAKLLNSVESYYADEYWQEVRDRAEAFGSDKYINAKNDGDIGLKLIDEMQKNNTGTQAEFDAALAMMKTYDDLLIACLDGDHPYGEYISDNNATEEADGTKTATCDFCGATDTITDEGTKLEKEEKPKEEEPKEEQEEEKASFFEKLIALIKGFFAKILSIFG